MEHPNILLVGHDMAPSQALSLLETELKRQGFLPVTVLGHGKEFAAFDPSLKIAAAVHAANIVICGMSSPAKNAETELQAARMAVRHGKNLFFYADKEGASRREWFSEFRDVRSTFLCINEEECMNAKELWPNATAIPTGNPTFEDFFFPRKSRAEIREMLGAGTGEKVVLIPGCKNPIVNVTLIARVLESLDTGVLAVFAPHPGDKTDIGVYEILSALSRRVTLRIIRKDACPSGDLVAGADLVIERNSTIGVTASCQRIPVIEHFDELSENWLEQDTGGRVPSLVQKGAAPLIRTGNVRELASAVTSALSGSWSFTKTQEKLYPRPAKAGCIVKSMVAAITRTK